MERIEDFESLEDMSSTPKNELLRYLALTAVTTRNSYPLPRLDESFDRLGRGKIFCKIDAT
jgi:hypothetical protein